MRRETASLNEQLTNQIKILQASEVETELKMVLERVF